MFFGVLQDISINLVFILRMDFLNLFLFAVADQQNENKLSVIQPWYFLILQPVD